jgi:hypothetical protein
MLRRQLAAVGGAVVALVAAGLGPAVADPGDGAGWGDGDVWAEADEESDDSGSSDSESGTDSSSGTSSSTSSGGEVCGTDSGGGLLMEMIGLEGSCAYAPALDTGDPGVVVPVVDARAEAERAYDSMDLATADVHMAPGPPLPTYPNLETWIWVPASQWQPLELSVTAGATTVHVEARPVRMEIDSGERDQMKYSAAAIDSDLVCYDAGRPWNKSLGDDAETSCGYTYVTTSSDNPSGGDRYRLTASIIYEGSWTCVGQCTEDGGSLGEAPGPTGAQSVDVQERQSVVVD